MPEMLYLTFSGRRTPAHSCCRVCTSGGPFLTMSSWVLPRALCLKGTSHSVLKLCGQLSSKQWLSDPGPFNTMAPSFSTCGLQNFCGCLSPIGGKGKSMANQMWKLFREQMCLGVGMSLLLTFHDLEFMGTLNCREAGKCSPAL